MFKLDVIQKVYLSCKKVKLNGMQNDKMASQQKGHDDCQHKGLTDCHTGQ